MKKIINNPDNFVEESIKGLVNTYPKIYKFSSVIQIFYRYQHGI